MPRPPSSVADAAAAAAAQLGLPEPVLVRVGSAAVFRSGATVLRVDPPGAGADDSVRVCRFLAHAGIPVAVPEADPLEVGGWVVTVWRWVEQSDGPIDGEELGRVIARLHAIDPAELRRIAPLRPWTGLRDLDPGPALTRIRDRSLLAPGEIEVLEAAHDRFRGWHRRTDAPAVVCHGDLHLNNVVGTADGLCVIDWGAVCVAPACWDHAMLTTLDRWGGPPGFYRAFVRGYGADHATDRGCQDLAALRLLVATANLALKAQRDARVAEELQIRLRYWMGDEDAGHWTAV